MEQPSENVLVLYPGELFPEGSECAISIFLTGSIDTREDRKFDWAGKFIQALVEITDPTKGILQFQNLKFVIANSAIPPINPAANLMNPEFVNKTNWSLQMVQSCDAIFVNILKKSMEAYPLFWLGLCLAQGKTVIRCPEEAKNYSLIRLACQQFGVSLLPGRVASVLSVLQSLAVMIPKFQEATKYQLPE